VVTGFLLGRLNPLIVSLRSRLYHGAAEPEESVLSGARVVQSRSGQSFISNRDIINP
jgi:hypothetical protein